MSALSESISNKRIAHAYLFSGGRGTGKTSVARIFAKSIECADDDIYEIDAASNRGIDDIREIREHVSVLPFHSPYKIYIIDEVHMLSKDAWNALLKTLEEPPSHVIFILATTEIEKVPDTIISRCQTFVFHKPTRDILRNQITKIADKEGYKLDSGGADLIALLGDGSFRDALGTLEKVISSSKDNKLSREEVENITGAPKAILINDFIRNILSKNVDGALSVLGKADQQGFAMKIFCTLLLEKLRFILLIQHSSSSEKYVRERVSSDDWDFISEQACAKSLKPSTLDAFLTASDAVNRTNIDILPLEIAVVKVCMN